MTRIGGGGIGAGNQGERRLTPVHVTAAIAGTTTVTVDIQPPAGETWVVYVSASGDYPSTNSGGVMVYNWDGTNYFGAISQEVPMGIGEAPGGFPIAGVGGWFRITNTNYLRIRWRNACATTGVRGHSYFGWKE